MTDDGRLLERKYARRNADYRKWKRQPREPLIPEDEGRELEFAWCDGWSMGYAAAIEAQAERIEKLEDVMRRAREYIADAIDAPSNLSLSPCMALRMIDNIAREALKEGASDDRR